jgi:hypothetical protein
MQEMLTWMHEKMDADLEENGAETKALRNKRMEANMNERTACQEATEANPEKMETNSEAMQSAEEHREVLKEGIAVKFSGTTKKRHRGRKKAAGRCGKAKELTRGDCGSRRTLAAACRKVFRRAAVARRREHGLQRQGKDNMAPRTPKGRTSRMQNRNKGPSTRRQLRLKIERRLRGSLSDWSS